MQNLNIDQLVDYEKTDLIGLLCNFCQSILFEPSACKICAFTYCRSCFFELASISEHCVCGWEIEGIKPISKLILKILNEKLFYCKHQKKGCDLIFKYSQILNHQTTCIFSTVSQNQSALKQHTDLEIDSGIINILDYRSDGCKNIDERGLDSIPNALNTPDSKDRKEICVKRVMEYSKFYMEALRKLEVQAKVLIKLLAKNDNCFNYHCQGCMRFSCRTHADDCYQCQRFFCYNCSKIELAACTECKNYFCQKCFSDSKNEKKCTVCYQKEQLPSSSKYYAKRTFKSSIPSDRIIIRYKN